MPTPYRKPKLPSKPAGMIVTCPICGRKGRGAKTSGPVRCSECGKEFRPGAGGTARTLILAALALVAIVGVIYFAVNRAGRIDAEEKEKAAAAERQQQVLQKGP
jgi:ribosomal protein S27E